MSKKNKKSPFGKRLWDSITEPLPDDNDDQNNEQIPLAYDLKDSATSASPKSARSTEVARSAATSAASDAVSGPEKVTSSQPIRPRAGREDRTGSQTSIPAMSQVQPIRASGAAKVDQSAAAESAPAPTAKTVGKVTTTHAGRSVASKADASRDHAARQTPSARPAAAATPTPSEQRPSSQSTRPRSTTAPSSATHQPRIAVRGTEDDDQQPELPLSREELYGDQQPNGGKEPRNRRTTTSARTNRRAERATAADESRLNEENPHLKKKSQGGPSRPHRKPGHKNWRLMLTSVVVLVIVLVGGLLMWNHSKASSADAKAKAETLVKSIYTTSAQRDLRSSASSDELQQLQTSINAMKDSSEKTALQKQYDYAKKMLAVRTDYQNLRNTAGLINADVTTTTITNNRDRLTSTGLTTHKTYFANKYDKKLVATGKVVKKVAGYDRAFKKLYNQKGKLKATTPSSEVNVVQANLKAYRTKSQLAANDYNRLKSDRKKLANTASSSSSSVESSSSSSSSSSSYSEPESSSSSTKSSSSTPAATSASSSATSYGNDTQTSSATSSSSTTGTTNAGNGNNTDNGDGTGTGTGAGGGQTTGTTNGTSTADGNN